MNMTTLTTPSLLAVLIALHGAFFMRASDATTERIVESTIDHVVVYQQGAQIERIGKAQIPTGISTLVFSELNTAIDPSQLRITGKSEFTVLSISHRYRTDTLAGSESYGEQLRLQLQRNRLNAEIAKENSWRVIHDREEQLLLNNQGFSVKDSGVDLDRLIRASEFFRLRYLAIHEARQEIDLRVLALQKQIQAVDVEMGELPQLRTETTLEVLVRVETETATSGELMLSYWMNQAGWTPSYNARVEDIADPLKLEYQALIHQSTGEDWEDVGLSIATGTPSKNRSKPSLKPWSLDGMHVGHGGASAQSANAWLKGQTYNPNVREVRGQLYDAHGNPLVGANVTAVGGSSGVVTDINGFYNLAVPTNVKNLSYSSVGHQAETIQVVSPVMNVSLAPQSAMLSDVVVAMDVAEDRESLFGSRSRRRENFNANGSPGMNFAAVDIGHSPTQTRFDIQARYDISADGQPQAVRILEHALDVEYLYQCTPKLDQQVYLTALFTDWEDLDLIDGRMHIYFEEDYVGESQLQLDFVEDTLSISLGPDPGIKVRRKRVLQEDRTSLITGKRTLERGYEFEILNRKNAEIHIQIDDQLPITLNDDIEVNRTRLDGGDVDEATGIVLWDRQIPAGESETISFRYEIRSPKEVPLMVSR
jgi:hypothetical protein